MSTDLSIVAGKHICGRVMTMRLNSIQEGKTIGWLIHGVCKKCKVVVVSKFFHQEEEPIEGVDFIVDENLTTKTTKMKKK